MKTRSKKCLLGFLLFPIFIGSVFATGPGKSDAMPEPNETIMPQNNAPSDLKRLLPSPDLTSTTKLIRTVPIIMSFKPVLNAKKYHFEIASDKQFTNLLFTGKTKTTVIKGPSLPDGQYWIRIRGIDSVGLEGKDSIHRFKIDTQRYTPIVEMPCGAYSGHEQPPIFRWSKTEQTKNYHFQLSRDEMFSVLLFDQEALLENEFSPGSLEPGVYYWRVSRVDIHGIEGPFRDPLKCYVTMLDLDTSDQENSDVEFFFPGPITQPSPPSPS